MNAPHLPLSGTVITFGEPLVSFAPDSHGRLSLTHQFRPYVGGAELNTAIGLARLGINASYAAAVGDDPFGGMIFDRLRANGVDTDHLQRASEGSTGVYFKQWTGLRRDMSVFYYRSLSPMSQGQWHSDALREALRSSGWAWMHTTGITRMIGESCSAQSRMLLREARRVGLTTSFDVNVRLKLGNIDAWRRQVEEILAHLDWFILGHEEAQWLFATEDSAQVEESVRKLGFKGEGVVLKRGAKGAEASCAGRVAFVPARPVDLVVDPVGAGDGFNAGWIAGMASGWPLEDALRLGSVVGAFAVSSAGDFDGYPFRREALAELEGMGGVSR
ncbi:MAG: sugar kinase [Bacilli bacterium]